MIAWTPRCVSAADYDSIFAAVIEAAVVEVRERGVEEEKVKEKPSQSAVGVGVRSDACEVKELTVARTRTIYVVKLLRQRSSVEARKKRMSVPAKPRYVFPESCPEHI